MQALWWESEFHNCTYLQWLCCMCTYGGLQWRCLLMYWYESCSRGGLCGFVKKKHVMANEIVGFGGLDFFRSYFEWINCWRCNKVWEVSGGILENPCHLWSKVVCFVGPCPHMDRDHCIGSNFWKFYPIRMGFTLSELVSLVKVFRLFRSERSFLVFRVWT